MTDQLFLALEAPGHGTHPHELRALATEAEQAGFTLVTFADSPVPSSPAASSIEAGTRAAFVSTTTNRIGLAPELHVTTTEPFHLATQLASLDHASNGRGAWVIGAANGTTNLATIGASPLDAKSWHREITDVIDVVRDLWDSWQDDAVIRDVTTGRYLDPSRVHHVDFQGARFSVKGPLITPRPPQGQLVVIAPEHLDVADRAEVVLVKGTDGPALGARATAARTAGAALVFAEVTAGFHESEADAPKRPEAGRLHHQGSAAALVDLLSSLTDTVNGVRLHPADAQRDTPILLETVAPALARAGRLRAPTPGATVRSTLGLPRPTNRFAAAATTAA